MDFTFLHGRIATALVLFTFMAGGYGLVEYFRKHAISPSYWGVIVVGNLMAVGQGVLGVILLLSGKQPAHDWLHILYGVVALMWIPIINFINHYFGQINDLPRNRWHVRLALKISADPKVREIFVVAVVSLFECGIALRAIATA